MMKHSSISSRTVGKYRFAQAYKSFDIHIHLLATASFLPTIDIEPEKTTEKAKLFRNSKTKRSYGRFLDSLSLERRVIVMVKVASHHFGEIRMIWVDAESFAIELPFHY